MSNFSLRKTLGRGLTLAIPVAVIVYVFIRIFAMLKKMAAPIAEKTGIDKILGGLTVTVIVVVLIFLFIFLLGVLMRISVIAKTGRRMEAVIFKLVPSLNQLKVMAADKLDLENSQNSWKPVIVLIEQNYNAAFIIEEDDELITLFVAKGTSLQEGEIVTTGKNGISYTPVSYNDLYTCSKAYGKGYITLIKNK